MDARDVEVVMSSGRTEGDEPRMHASYSASHALMPGPMGNFFAGLTMLAAALIIAALLFGKLLLVSAAATILWPLIFSPEFTLWVFGSETAPFWKLLLIFTFSGFTVRWIRGWLKE